MPVPITNEFTLRKLVQNSYQYMRNRFDNLERDSVRMIRVIKVHVYDAKEPGKARTTYRILSQSTPQYWPYFTQKDSRGRLRRTQRKYKHQYEVVIQVDKLSIDVPFKGRTGADRKWRFDAAGRSRKNSRGQVIEGTNIKLGINGDFFFRCSYLWKLRGILYGRNWAAGPPKKTNPKEIIFADKHFLSTIKALMDNRILQGEMNWT